MPTSNDKPGKMLRCLRLTPGQVLVILSAIEGILLLCEWFHQTPKGWAVLISIAAVASTIVLGIAWFLLALVLQCRFQFTIRSLLLLTVAVAISASWLETEMRQAKRQRESFEVFYKLQRGDYMIDVSMDTRNAGTPVPAWLCMVFGNDFFLDIRYVSFGGLLDSDLNYISKLTHLNRLDLSKCPKITDAGLVHLEGLQELKYIGLSKTQVTDAGLKHFEGLKELECVDLSESKVTDAGVAKLQKSLPNCKIYY